MRLRVRDYDLLIFDLDGVVTRTAKLHAAAWKSLFDEFLAERARREGAPFRPFDAAEDYRRYVDGKLRYDGVRSFLGSRGVDLPFGAPDDPPTALTVCGLGNRKDRLFQDQLRSRGVEVYEGTVEFLRQARSLGFKTAIVTSSRNGALVTERAGLSVLIDARVDGVDSTRLGLQSKPAPDLFLDAARKLGVDPARAVVFEDAQAGVEAARRGGFGLVVGVDRAGQARVLEEKGADLAVKDLGELSLADDTEIEARRTDLLPSALERIEEIRERARGRRLAVFLDYDGTLAPIADRPEKARLPGHIRDAVRALAERCPVAVISGRDLRDVRQLVGLDGVVFAGSHGFDIEGPGGLRREHPEGASFLPSLDKAERALKEALARLEGAIIERKRFSVAVHYRLVAESSRDRVEKEVERVFRAHPDLRRTSGKMVYELRPRLRWDKGRAVLWLLQATNLGGPEVLAVYIGDDLTDEDAFRALADRGIGIIVREEPRRTEARYALENPEEVGRFLGALSAMAERAGACRDIQGDAKI
ncbi:MAG: trehalose-phosphatase [Planctomycetes bacterium]|nr:trehalose-phosphatase [Planctomycetota bacterium]